MRQGLLDIEKRKRALAAGPLVEEACPEWFVRYVRGNCGRGSKSPLESVVSLSESPKHAPGQLRKARMKAELEQDRARQTDNCSQSGRPPPLSRTEHKLKMH